MEAEARLLIVIASGLAAGTLAAVHMVAGKLRFLEGIPSSRWLSIARGDWRGVRLSPRAARTQPGAGRPLWPDTFNNCFHPETARAGVEVLEAAGHQVIVPEAWLCCGRPLYDYGMLDRAKRQLRQILDALRPYIADGVPVIALEPSCAAVFRDELINLFPHDADARRPHQQTFLLSEFLEEHAKGFDIPRLPRRALVHGHCHHKAIMG